MAYANPHWAQPDWDEMVVSFRSLKDNYILSFGRLVDRVVARDLGDAIVGAI